MKNRVKLLGTQIRRLYAIALAAVIGFSFAACFVNYDVDVDPPPAYLVAKWSQKENDNVVFQITSNGTFLHTTTKNDLQKVGVVSFTGNPGGGSFTLYFEPAQQIIHGKQTTGNWSLSGTELKLTNCKVPLENGTYIKQVL
jgi:hypothetical protein